MMICRACKATNGGDFPHPFYCGAHEARANHDWVNVETREGLALLGQTKIGRERGMVAPNEQWSVWTGGGERVVDGYPGEHHAAVKALELANSEGRRYFIVGDGRRMRVIAPTRSRQPDAGWQEGFERLVLHGVCPYCQDSITGLQLDRLGMTWICGGGCNP